MPQDFYSKLETLLKKDSRFIDQDGDLLKSNVIDCAYKADKKLIELLLSQNELKKKFFIKIKDSLVFNINDFVSYIQDKNFLADSYTKYRNKIGLNIDGKFLNERKEVALVWPFKDCILEGGMTKEDEKRKEIFFNEILAQDEIDKLLAPKVLTNWKRYTQDGETPLPPLSRGKFSPTDKGGWGVLQRDKNGTIRENLIIKGNNLLALHSLKQQFQNKIKLIYIDPPYNTGNDSFGYNDNFNHSTWLTFMKNRLEVGKLLLKESGVMAVSCDDNEQAYLKILMDDIFGIENFITTFYVQVRYENKTLSEDNDFQKVMECVHLYAKDNKVFKPNKIQEEYSLDKFCYQITELSKGKEINIAGKKVEIFKEGDYKIQKIKEDINGLKETWATGSLIRQGGTAAEFLALHLINRKKEDGLKVLYKVHNMGRDGLGFRYILGPQRPDAFRGKFYSGVPESIRDEVMQKKYLKETPIPNLIYNYFNFSPDFGNCRKEGGVDIGGGKKPENLLKYIIEYFSNEKDIVLDYHAGSGTTCAVAHKINRQYIGIEQLDYGKNDITVRLQNVIGKKIKKSEKLLDEIDFDNGGISKAVNWKGGGDFVYCELMEYNEQFVDKIKKADTTQKLLNIWKDMKTKSFLNYNVDIKKFDETIDEFKKFPLAKQQRILFDFLNKNQLYVGLSEIEDKEFGVSKEDKKLNEEFYKDF